MVQICISLWKKQPKVVQICIKIDFSQKKVRKNLEGNQKNINFANVILNTIFLP